MKKIAVLLRYCADLLESGKISYIVKDTATIITLAIAIMVLAGVIGLFMANLIM